MNVLYKSKAETPLFFLARNGRNLDIIKACGMSATLLRLSVLCEGDCSQCDGCSIISFVVFLFEKGNVMV